MRAPFWIVAAALFVVAGAGAGTLLGNGGVSGTVPTLVEQGIVAAQPTVVVEGGGFSNDQSFASVSDGGDKITTAIEVNTGDKFKIQVPLQNKSNSSMVVKMSMDIPEGLTVDVDSDGSDDSDTTGIGNVTRIGLMEWTFDLATSTSASDKLEIEIAHADDSPPGFYQVTATLKQVAN
jgi:hypothetical protein